MMGGNMMNNPMMGKGMNKFGGGGGGKNNQQRSSEPKTNIET